MTPIILWISGGGNDGKTTLRRELLKNSDIPYFKVDTFNRRMQEWMTDQKVYEICAKHAKRKSRNILDYLYKIGYGLKYAKLFLTHDLGFHPEGNLSVIEGYMHKEIQDMISKMLQNRGYHVWYAMRRHRLKNLRNDSNWQ